MSSIPNRFNFYSDDAMNHPGFLPIQTSHNSNMVRSMFISSNHANHGDLFSPPPSFTCYQNSHVSSSSFGFNSSNMNYQMRRNIGSDLVMPSTAQVSSVSNYLPLRDNPHFTQISFTQTITNRYSAIVPTNTITNFQNDIERIKHMMESRTNIWNPSIHPPNFLDEPREIFAPEPLNVVYPNQNNVYREHFDMFSPPANRNQDQRVSQDGRFFKGNPKQTKYVEETIGYYDSEEDAKSDDEHYDGRTHSLPYEKYGPYTCPKCDGVFDTSQKFAAHMSTHYKNETDKERVKRYRARNKNKYRKLNDEVHHHTQKIKLEDEDNNSGGTSQPEAFQDLVVVKEERV